MKSPGAIDTAGREYTLRISALNHITQQIKYRTIQRGLGIKRKKISGTETAKQ